MIGTRMLSMTGYGKAQKIDNGFDLTVEIRSLNNRYLDISFKIPAFLSFYEPQLRDIIKKSVIRGKVNVNIDVKKVFTTDSQVNFNFEKARELFSKLEILKKTFAIEQNIKVEHLLHFPDVPGLRLISKSGTGLLRAGHLRFPPGLIRASVAVVLPRIFP